MVISLTLEKTNLLHFFRHGDQFYNGYITTTDKNYLGGDGYGVKPKHFLQRIMICTSFGDPLQAMWDIYRKIAREKFGKKRKSNGFIYFPG